MIITKLMVRQRLHHWRELKDPKFLVLKVLNGSSFKLRCQWQIVSSTIRNTLWVSSLEN